MYIEKTTRYYRGSMQAVRSARFLVLVQREGSGDIRAAVRRVAMVQCGHWMMGRARLFGEAVSLSGSYGSDGGPVTVSTSVFYRCIPLPSELVMAWNSGGGWNGAGAEAPRMLEWAQANLRLLLPTGSAAQKTD